MKLHHDFSKLNIIVDNLNKNKKSIGKKWIRRERVSDVLSPHAIEKEFFLKYFGFKVIDYIVGVIDKGNKEGNCPIVHVMLQYFHDKAITIGDTYLICSELRNVLVLHYMKNFPHLDEDVYFEFMDLIDTNFEGVLNEYYLKECGCVNSKLNDKKELKHYVEDKYELLTSRVEENEKQSITLERAKDLRFTQNDKISAREFLDTLDSTIIDKVEIMSEKLDEFMGVLYDFEDAKTIEEAINIIPKIQLLIEDVYTLINSLMIFDVTARAFSSLSHFLSTITTEHFEDMEKHMLLATMLLAIMNDIEKWVRVVFVDQTTEDIHYFDASFSSNILEVENLFLVSDDDDDDDLEFF